MHIPIPIPLGVKYVAAAQGTVLKHITCAHCQQPFAFLLDLQATGEDLDLLFLDRAGSSERAREKAQENLQRKGQKIVVPVPCPHCGSFQDDMVQALKDDDSMNWQQISGGLLFVLAFLPLLFDYGHLWILTLILASAGLGLVAYGYVVAFRFDPNAGDPEPRKAIGRSKTIWGERLAEITRNLESKES